MFKSMVLIGLVALPPLVVQAQQRAFNYQDCLLGAVKQGTIDSQRDIGTVKRLCEEQFPETAPNILGQKLDDELLANIDIWVHRDPSENIKGSVYNGNAHVVVTQLTLLLTPHKSGDRVQDFFDSEEYQLHLKIPPYQTKPFFVSVDDTEIPGDFHWNLIRAWGY